MRVMLFPNEKGGGAATPQASPFFKAFTARRKKTACHDYACSTGGLRRSFCLQMADGMFSHPDPTSSPGMERRRTFVSETCFCLEHLRVVVLEELLRGASS